MKYAFQAKLWKYHGPASWYFVTLPKTLAAKIRTAHGLSEEGWGRLKVEASIGSRAWTTAIWFDTKAGSYLLPVKAIIRKTLDLKVDDSLKIKLVVQTPDKKLQSWLKS